MLFVASVAASLSSDGLSGSLNALCDGSLLTVFSSDPGKDAGKTLRIDVKDVDKVTLFFSEIDTGDKGLVLRGETSEGKAGPDIPVKYLPEVDTSGYDCICLTFGSSRTSVAEIVF